MIAAMLARALAVVLPILLLGACSETTLRRDSLSYVTIGDQEILVSWVGVPPDAIDLVVEAAPGSDKPLARATAVEAAGRVAAGRCLFDRVHAVESPVQYPDSRFAFRYVCGGAPAAATDKQG